MMYPIVKDIFEKRAKKLGLILSKHLNVIEDNNEPKGLADYYWNNGHIIQWERKKSLELLMAIGKRLDLQLNKYLEARPDSQIGIIQEGIITPTDTGKCQTWVVRKNLVRSRVVNMPYTAYRAYIYRRECEGFPVIITVDEADTAYTLIAMLVNSMKPEHRSLKRSVVIKPTPQMIDEERWLINLQSIVGVGEATAIKALNHYLTPADVYTQPYTELVRTLGKSTANNIFNGIGREVK